MIAGNTAKGGPEAVEGGRGEGEGLLQQTQLKSVHQSVLRDVVVPVVRQ